MRLPESGLTCFLEHPKSSLGLLEGQHVGCLGCMEAEAAAVVALASEVVVDAQGRGGHLAVLILCLDLPRSFSDMLLLCGPGSWEHKCCPQPAQEPGQAAAQGAQGPREHTQ